MEKRPHGARWLGLLLVGVALLSLAGGCELAGHYQGDNATVDFNTGGLTNQTREFAN